MTKHCYILLPILLVMLGCASTQTLAPDKEKYLTKHLAPIEFRGAQIGDLIDYLNVMYAREAYPEVIILASEMTPQEQANTPSITLERDPLTLQTLLPLLEANALVKAKMTRSHIVLLPDTKARERYRKENAEELNAANSVLNKALEDLKAAKTIKLHDPEGRDWFEVSGEKAADVIVSWIEEQPKGYDKGDTEAIGRGDKCACLPWAIAFGDPEQFIGIHSHSLRINGKISFQPAVKFDLDAFRSHLIEQGVIKEDK